MKCFLGRRLSLPVSVFGGTLAAVAIAVACDKTNPDDFDAGADAAGVRPDAVADAPSDALADGELLPFSCDGGCGPKEFCLAYASAPSADAGDAAADGGEWVTPSAACRPLPAECIAADAGCGCFSDAGAVPGGGDAADFVECATGVLSCSEKPQLEVLCIVDGGV